MFEAARAHCYRCDKPTFMCLCDRIARVAHRTPVTIVQHPRERFHPFGTARIARLGLERCDIRVARGEAAHFGDRRVSLPLSLEAGAAVLYPHPDAPTLETLSASERPSRLVVLDGTWSHAKRLWADNPALAELRCVRLEPSAPSRYRIRREPSFEAISTLEAIVLALSILEPERAAELETLLVSFDAMIDDQLARRSSGPSRPRRKPVRRAPTPPADLFAPMRRLVLVDAEHCRPKESAKPELARLSAMRLEGDALLDVLVGPTPPPRRLAHIGVTRERFESAVDRADALQQLSAFLRPDDVVLSWHRLPLRLVSDVIRGRAAIELKAVYCNLEGGRCGGLGELVARLGLATDPPRVDGRMGPWLSSAARITGWLRSRASRPALVEP